MKAADVLIWGDTAERQRSTFTFEKCRGRSDIKIPHGCFRFVEPEIIPIKNALNPVGKILVSPA
jgi:hypothetical protein